MINQNDANTQRETEEAELLCRVCVAAEEEEEEEEEERWKRGREPDITRSAELACRKS